MNEIKLLCSDIDGTLVRNDKTLSEENKKWIRRLKEKGVEFSIVSGRTNRSVSRYYNELGIKGATSALNGSALYSEDDKVLSSVFIPKEISINIVSILKASKSEFIMVSLDEWYAEDKESAIYKNKRKIYDCEGFVCPFEKVAEEKEISKFLVISSSQRELQDVEREVRKLYSEKEVTYFPAKGLLEIMPKSVNKGNGLEELARYYGLDRSRVMAIGDEVNDIEMIERAGIGVAMGNAISKVKEVADIITATNEEDGVARIIKEYFF